MSGARASIVVLGASGLIGRDVAARLARGGRRVVAVAREFAGGAPPGCTPVVAPFADLDADALAALIAPHAPSLVLNCVGVLQGAGVRDAHSGFVQRLVAACRALPSPPTLAHLSIPGDAAGDATEFARSKRDGEATIRASGLANAILRPGFVVAPGAYGGSALVRAVAASPVTLPADELARPFRAVASADIARTVAHLADHPPGEDADGGVDGGVTWDLMHPAPTTLGDVVEAHRAWLGGPRARLAVPGWLTGVGGALSDLAGRLGWRPPTRSTALAELRRGIAGDPAPWMAATGIEPLPVAAALAEHPATVADHWFARLYPLKALALATLVVFWAASGIIALAAFTEARAILLAAGFPPLVATAVTWISSLMDIAIGALIAHRRTARLGLWAGIAVSLFYMAGAAVLTPALWLDPVGALVKTFPAIVLMMVCLATLEDR